MSNIATMLSEDVERLLDVPRGKLMSKCREDYIVQGRWIIFEYLNQVKGWDYKQICYAFKKHRTTVLYAMNQSRDRLEADPHYSNRYTVLMNYLINKYGSNSNWIVNEYV